MRTLRSVSPQRPHETVGEFAVSEPAQVERLVDAARAGQRAWLSLGAAGRASALSGAGAELRARREEAVALIVREVGVARLLSGNGDWVPARCLSLPGRRDGYDCAPLQPAGARPATATTIGRQRQ